MWNLSHQRSFRSEQRRTRASGSVAQRDFLGTQTRAEETLVPQRPEVADRVRGTHQRGQAAARSQAAAMLT